MFFLCLVSVFLHLAALCTFVFSCAVRSLGAFPRIFNILVRHTSIPLFPRGTWPSPIARACACLRAGRCGVSYLVSPCSCLRLPAPCGLVYVCACVRGPSLWRSPSHCQHTCSPYRCFPVVGGLRLFAFSLFPLCPWPPHTFCAFVDFFFLVVYLAVVGAYGGINMGDIWLWFVLPGMPFDVRGGSSLFFACGVVWFSHLRMCSGGYDM